MNSVYIKAVEFNNNVFEKVQWKDDLFLEENETTQKMVQYVDGLVTACRVAMSRDTSKNAQPAIKQLLLSRLNISTLEPASCLS